MISLPSSGSRVAPMIAPESSWLQLRRGQHECDDVNIMNYSVAAMSQGDGVDDDDIEATFCWAPQTSNTLRSCGHNTQILAFTIKPFGTTTKTHSVPTAPRIKVVSQCSGEIAQLSTGINTTEILWTIIKNLAVLCTRLSMLWHSWKPLSQLLSTPNSTAGLQY